MAKMQAQARPKDTLEADFANLDADSPEHRAADELQAALQPKEQAGTLAVREPSASPVIMSDAEAEFAAYTGDRELFFGTQFSKNRSMARAGVKFDIQKAGESYSEGDDGEMIPTYVYIVTLKDDYTHEDQNTGEVMTFRAGDLQKLSLTQNSIRRTDYNRILSLIQKYGGVPNCAMNEYLSNDKTKSNSHGIVHASQWRHIRDAKKS